MRSFVFLRSFAFLTGATSSLLFACSTANTANRLGPSDSGPSDAAIDAYKPPSDHGLTRSTCDEDRIATEEDSLVYRTFESGGATRSFHVLRPGGAKCTSKSALVILVHGAISTDIVKKNPGDYFARETTFDGLVNNYILATPNAVAVDGQFVLSADNANDMTFISDLIEALTIREPVNPKRIYVMGYGEGGAVALKAGCDYASRVAGVASIGGGLLKSTKATCKPSEGVSVVLGAATKDSVIPYGGDENYEPFTDARDFFLGAMKCTDETVEGTDTTANVLTYPTCDNSAQMQTIQVTGGTHDSIRDFLLPAWDDFLRKRFKS